MLPLAATLVIGPRHESRKEEDKTLFESFARLERRGALEILSRHPMVCSFPHAEFLSHPKVARRGFAGEGASGRDGGKREAAAEPPPRAARSRPLDHDLNSAAHIFG